MNKILLRLVSFCFLFTICFGDKYANRYFIENTRLPINIYTHKNFTGSFLNKVICSNLKFFNCNFQYTQCIETDFTNSDLYLSDFRFSISHKAKFNNAKMINAWLWDGDFRGADFTNANLERAIVFDWKIGFEDDDKTIVEGANFKKAWGLTNEQKAYLRENGAINVPEDCDEEKEKREFKVWLDKIQEELFILYPLNKWAKSYFSFVKRLLLLPFRSCLKN